MKKQTRFLLPFSVMIVVIVAAAVWRTWGPDGALHTWPDLDGGLYTESVNYQGLRYFVPPDEVYASGLTPEDRPALNDPDMVSIATVDAKLADELEGIAVTVGSEHYFYPFQILNWHEVVNASLNGLSLVITYSPLSGSAVVYEDERKFADAGKVYNNTLLLAAEDDDTLWSQTMGQSVVGEGVGELLTTYPSTVMSWATWKDLYPSGLALSTDTGYARDYGRHPYASYETSPAVFFPLNHTFGKIAPKDLVYRLNIPGRESIVFLDRYLPAQTDANMDVGEGEYQDSVVAFYDEAQDVVRAFNRKTDGQTLTFEQKGKKITDAETGSSWSATGLAIGGALTGTQLAELPLTRHYAFAHFAMYPNSLISGQELLPTEDVLEEGIEFDVE
ncbi:MAG: DUF3179 domain-containing (seleno)protein [Patescibacteria group bacterium]